MLAALNEEEVGARGQGWGFRLLQGSGAWGGMGASRGQIGKDLIGEFRKFTFLILSMVEWEREDYYIYHQISLPFPPQHISQAPLECRVTIGLTSKY